MRKGVLREMNKRDYTGIVVEESIDDNRILNYLNITKVEISKDKNPEDRWHMYWVEASEKDIKSVAKHIKRGKWYMHFWKGNEGIVVFKDKTFSFNYKDKITWKEAVDYGLSLGIPRKQLDFLRR